jgi:hypothetical protein
MFYEFRFILRIILKYFPARSYVKFALWDGHFQFPTDKTKTDFLEDHIKKKKIISYSLELFFCETTEPLDSRLDWNMPGWVLTKCVFVSTGNQRWLSLQVIVLS